MADDKKREEEQKMKEAPSNKSRSTSERQPYESWAAAKETPPAILASARVMHRWAEGKRLTEQQYDEAVKAAGEEVIGVTRT